MSRLYRSIAAILAERLRLTSMHLDCLIEGIDGCPQVDREAVDREARHIRRALWHAHHLETKLL